ncbi:MAG TPA: putative metal-binding motif-containing protein, partial [Myxococcota bacterium]|nr:putative metal-binding motif-containing protein [Myxococcota bacterium]
SDDTDDTSPPDADHDGTPDALDCAPSDASVHPGASETCDGLDNDCDPGTPDADGTVAWLPASGAPMDLTQAFPGFPVALQTFTTPGDGTLQFCGGIFGGAVVVGAGQAVTIRGVRPGTYLSALALGRAVTVGAGSHVVVEDLGLSGGISGGNVEGGALYVQSDASAVLRRVVVSNSYGAPAPGLETAGALYVAFGGSLALEDSQVIQSPSILTANGATVTMDRVVLADGYLGAISGTLVVRDAEIHDVGTGWTRLGDVDATLERVSVRNLGRSGQVPAEPALFRANSGPVVLRDVTFSHVTGVLGAFSSAELERVQVEDLTATDTVLSTSVGLTMSEVSLVAVNTTGGNVVNGRTSSTLGSVTVEEASARGSIVELNGAQATVTDSSFTACHGGVGNGGGALAAVTASTTIARAVFQDNTSDSRGGALLIGPFIGGQFGTAAISATEFIGNRSLGLGGAGAGEGGAVYAAWSSVTFEDCTFDGNDAAGAGGAIYAERDATFSGGTFTDNAAGTWGGAIANRLSWGIPGSLTGVTIWRNASASGGAIGWMPGIPYVLADVSMGEGADDNTPADAGTDTVSYPVEIGDHYSGTCTNTCP